MVNVLYHRTLKKPDPEECGCLLVKPSAKSLCALRIYIRSFLMQYLVSLDLVKPSAKSLCALKGDIHELAYR